MYNYPPSYINTIILINPTAINLLQFLAQYGIVGLHIYLVTNDAESLRSHKLTRADERTEKRISTKLIKKQLENKYGVVEWR